MRPSGNPKIAAIGVTGPSDEAHAPPGLPTEPRLRRAAHHRREPTNVFVLRLKDLDVDRWTLRRHRGRVRLVDADPAGIQELVVPEPLCDGNGPGRNAHSATNSRTRSRCRDAQLEFVGWREAADDRSGGPSFAGGASFVQGLRDSVSRVKPHAQLTPTIHPTGIGSSLDLESFRRDSEVLGRLRGAERFGRVPAVQRAEAKSGRELGIQPEPPGEPWVERQDGTPPQQFFRGRDDEHTAVFLRAVQEDPSLREIEEPFVERRGSAWRNLRRGRLDRRSDLLAVRAVGYSTPARVRRNLHGFGHQVLTVLRAI